MLFVASRVVVFLFLAGCGTDLGVHREYWRKIVGGAVPFRDLFPEYPPLGLAFTGVPVLFDRSLQWYFPIFRAVCCAVDCGMWVGLLVWNRERPSRNLLYVLGTTALGPLIYDRMDIVLGAILFASIVFQLRGRAKLFAATVGVGIAFKLIPLVWVPVILAVEARRGLRQLAWAIVLLALPTLLSFDAMAMLGGWNFEPLLAYHTMRGIQIESTPASVEMVQMRLGAPGAVSFEYGSVNLHTRYEQMLIHIATALLGTTLLASALIALRRGLGREVIALLLAADLAAALVFSKVLSPQYVLFLLPVVVALPSASTRIAATEWLLVFAVCVLTGIAFPWAYEQVIQLTAPGEGLLAARNVALAMLAGLLLYRALARLHERVPACEQLSALGRAARPQ